MELRYGGDSVKYGLKDFLWRRKRICLTVVLFLRISTVHIITD